MRISIFLKGFFIGGLILFCSNFIWGFLSNCTYAHVIQSFNENSDSIMTNQNDTIIVESEINLNIAKKLQADYGADGLMITSISSPLNKYEYYVSGVKGVKDLEKPNYRLKKVTFTKEDDNYRINVIYNMNDGMIIKIENDESPIMNVPPIVPQNPNKEPKDTIKHNDTSNNKDVGTATSDNNSDYSNNSDV